VKKVFKTYDFLGWYQTGGKVTEADLNIHKQVNNKKSISFRKKKKLIFHSKTTKRN